MRWSGISMLAGCPPVDDVIHQSHQHTATDNVAQYDRHQIAEKANPGNGMGARSGFLESL